MRIVNGTPKSNAHGTNTGLPVAPIALTATAIAIQTATKGSTMIPAAIFASVH